MGAAQEPLPLSDIPQKGYRRLALLEGPFPPAYEGGLRRFARQEPPRLQPFLTSSPPP